MLTNKAKCGQSMFYSMLESFACFMTNHFVKLDLIEMNSLFKISNASIKNPMRTFLFFQRFISIFFFFFALISSKRSIQPQDKLELECSRNLFCFQLKPFGISYPTRSLQMLNMENKSWKCVTAHVLPFFSFFLVEDDLQQN